MFNRPGPRLVDALEWLCATLLGEKDLLPPGFPVEWLSPPSPTDKAPSKEPKRARDVTDIEELHRCAVEKGQLQYNDPATGYSVFTQLFMIERGWCCGNGCRHCPYGHQNVEPGRKKDLSSPINVPGTACPRKSSPKPA